MQKKQPPIKWTREYVEYVQMIAQDALSLNQKIRSADDSETEIGDLLEDTLQPSPEDLMIEQDRKDIIAEALVRYLNPREEKIICLRFGFDGNRPKTLEEIAQELHLTRERVRQIENSALRKLKVQFRRHNITKETV